MNFELSTMLASFVIGSIGFVMSAYGKKMSRAPHMFFGVLLMCAAWIPNALLMVGVGALLIAGDWFAVRRGM